MILEANHITKRFGNFEALNDLTWTVEEGQTKAIIGPNGAGKTTFLNCLSGELEPTTGSITHNGIDITGKKPHEIVRAGLAKTYQINNLFDELSAFENIRLAVQARDTQLDFYTRVSELTDINKRTEEIIDKVGLADKKEWPPEELSHGDQRKVEIGLTLGTDPDVIILDEPTAGMSATEREEMIDLFEELAESRTLVITEHDIELIMEVADTITVLHQGSIIAEGEPSEIQQDAEVRRVYIER